MVSLHISFSLDVRLAISCRSAPFPLPFRPQLSIIYLVAIIHHNCPIKPTNIFRLRTLFFVDRCSAVVQNQRGATVSVQKEVSMWQLHGLWEFSSYSYIHTIPLFHHFILQLFNTNLSLIIKWNLILNSMKRWFLICYLSWIDSSPALGWISYFNLFVPGCNRESVGGVNRNYSSVWWRRWRCAWRGLSPIPNMEYAWFSGIHSLVRSARIAW